MNTGTIYKIQINDKCYVGSTKKSLLGRETHHNWCLNNGYETKLYQYARENDIEWLQCQPIEEVKYNIIQELRLRENYYKKLHNAELNMKSCESYGDYDPRNHSTQENLTYLQTQILQKQKQYYQQNKERIKQQVRNNRLQKIEDNKQYQKQYYQYNKQQILNKYHQSKQLKRPIQDLTQSYYARHKQQILEQAKQKYLQNKLKEELLLVLYDEQN